MKSLSTEIASVEPYSYSSTELEDSKRQFDYYSMLYDFLYEYSVGSEELDNGKLVNIVRLIDAPTRERKSINYMIPSKNKVSKAKTGYKLYIDKVPFADNSYIEAGTVITLTVVYTPIDEILLPSISLSSGSLSEVSDGFTIILQNKIIPLSDEGGSLTIFVQAMSNGVAIGAGQTFIIPIGQKIELVNDVDGNTYTTLKIGNHTWMLQNLSTTKYQDGTTIPNLTAALDWSAEDGSPLHNGAYCWNNNDIANKPIYGALYNWYALNGPVSIAPKGWHVATKYDYDDLITFLGGISIAGGKLKQIGTSNWTGPNTGATDTYEFTALPGGYRYPPLANFLAMGTRCWFWQKPQVDQTRAFALSLYNTDALAHNTILSKNYGLSVRCVKD
jgi:uncharacterized protein (TIGR02145 family)